MSARMKWLIALLLCVPVAVQSQEKHTDVRVRVSWQAATGHRPLPAVVWLEPLPGTYTPAFVPHGPYTLLQRNRMFHPHVQIVPVGAVVQFPNADPFFHNVFSLFEGKRFDLGLYEAGSSKSVTFPREGVSYIFCNIHPEMSAVILALATPYYALGQTGDTFVLHGVNTGEYEMKVWVEGAQPTVLERSDRVVHIAQGTTDLGEIVVTANPYGMKHTDKFGRPYDGETRPTY